MGTNRRYAHHVETQIAVRAQQATSTAQAVGLSPIEVDLANHPARSSPTPIPVHAWVHFTPVPARVEGVALSWNNEAVHIQFTDSNGREQQIWVWASAVERANDSPQ
jgi:hypothetical protein